MGNMGASGVPSDIEIQIYKVDDFEHHVPESIDKAFKAEVKRAGKQYQSIRVFGVTII